MKLECDPQAEKTGGLYSLACAVSFTCEELKFIFTRIAQEAPSVALALWRHSRRLHSRPPRPVCRARPPRWSLSTDHVSVSGQALAARRRQQNFRDAGILNILNKFFPVCILCSLISVQGTTKLCSRNTEIHPFTIRHIAVHKRAVHILTITPCFSNYFRRRCALGFYGSPYGVHRNLISSPSNNILEDQDAFQQTDSMKTANAHSLCRPCPSGADCCSCPEIEFGSHSSHEQGTMGPTDMMNTSTVTQNIKLFGRPCARCYFGSTMPTAKPGFVASNRLLERGDVITFVSCHTPEACLGGFDVTSPCSKGFSY